MDTIWGNLNRARLSYEGEWLNGLPHGNGKLVFQDGTIYVGEFFENDFHGKGKTGTVKQLLTLLSGVNR